MNVRMENLSFEVYFWGNNRILTCEYNSYVENPAFIWSSAWAFNKCFPQKEISLIEYQQVVIKFSLCSIRCFFHQSLSVHFGVNNYYKIKKLKKKIQILRSEQMGGSESAQKKEEQKVKINHPKFKEVKLIEQEDILRNTLPIEHDADFQIWQQKLNKVIKIEDQIILLPKAYQYTRKAICGTAGIIQIDYDNYQYVLVDELKNRQKIKHYFEELELWYLIYSLVSASHHFRSINSKIGDVRPQNIFINEQGHVKIANIYSWPAENTNYSKTVIDNQKTYLSPEELISAKQGSSENFIDAFKAQSFSIGLTLLQSAILHDMGPLYLPTKQLDYRKLDKFMTEWWGLKFNAFDQKSEQKIIKQYSDALKITIAAMCQIQSRQRLSSQELYNWLKPFHNKIIDLKPFEPGVPPVKNLQVYTNRLKRGKQPSNHNKLHLPRQKLIELRSNQCLSAKKLNELSQHDRYRKFDESHAMPIYLHHQNMFNQAQTKMTTHETSNPLKINPPHFPHPFTLPLTTMAPRVNNPALATLRTTNNSG